MEIFDIINGALTAIAERIQRLEPLVRQVPWVPPTAGQRHYNARQAYLAEHINPLVNEIIQQRVLLGETLGARTDEFLASRGHSAESKDQLRSFRAAKQTEADKIDARLRHLLEIVPHDNGEPITELLGLIHQ